MGQYRAPMTVDRAEFVNLMPAYTSMAELDPKTPVLCLNRGPHWIRDKYDAQPYDVPPFAKFEVTYGAALHLQKRAIVPGTRNPDPNDTQALQYQSWIAILGIDPEAACAPFTDAQLRQFGESSEGLDRSLLPEGDRDVQIISVGPTGAIGPAQATGGTGSRGVQPLSQNLVGGTADARERAMERVTDSDARSEAARALGQGWQPTEQPGAEPSAPIPAPAIGRRSANQKATTRPR